MPEIIPSETLIETTDKLRHMVRQVLREHADMEREKSEPAYKAELQEEKKRREQLEKRVNELAEENQRSKAMAEQAERFSSIRAELQRQGVSKVELAFRAIRDEVVRDEGGRLVVHAPEGEVGLGEYVTSFINDNPELLPARIAGGSGAGSSMRSGSNQALSVDLDRIKPGMDAGDLARMREEISRAALQALSGR